MPHDMTAAIKSPFSVVEPFEENKPATQARPAKPKTAKLPKTAAGASALSQLAPDGLRYTKKPVGSPFANQHTFSSSTLSCLFCGSHRKPSERMTQNVCGRKQAVCSPPCARNVRGLKLAAAADRISASAASPSPVAD